MLTTGTGMALRTSNHSDGPSCFYELIVAGRKMSILEVSLRTQYKTFITILRIDNRRQSVLGSILLSSLAIRRMRVSKFPSIRPSCYGREERKCWSQIALPPMAENRVFAPPPHLIGTSHRKILTIIDFWGPKPNFFSLTVCS